jgi:hypothetical protein
VALIIFEECENCLVGNERCNLLFIYSVFVFLIWIVPLLFAYSDDRAAIKLESNSDFAASPRSSKTARANCSACSSPPPVGQHTYKLFFSFGPFGGHHDPQKGFDPEAIEETKTYLQHFNQHHLEIAQIEKLYNKMMELHPARLNPGSAWAGANASKNPNSIWALMAAKKK